MPTPREALATAWNRALDDLGIDTRGTVVLGGPLAERFGDGMPVGVADGVSGVVLLGGGAPIADSATARSTGLDRDIADAVVMVDAWDDLRGLEAVVTESTRIGRPGCRLWFGSLDVERLTRSAQSMRRSTLLYDAFPDVARAVRPQVDGVAAVELMLLRHRLKGVRSAPIELPIDAFASVDSYVDAALAGMWPGVRLLEPSARQRLETTLRARLRGTDTPIVEYLPWLVASAVNPP